MHFTSLNLRKIINVPLTAVVIFSLLVANLAFAQVNAGESARVIVQFKGPVTAQDKAFVRGLGGSITHEYSLVPAIATVIPAQALRGLQHNPRITVIEKDTEVQAVFFNDEYLETWSIGNIKAKPVHEGGNTGATVKIGIIDSGISNTHPDLNVVGEYDFVNNTSTSDDVYGHGTHVAGTACATMNGWGAVGVAPNCELYDLRVLNDSGSGYTSNILASIEWAVAHDLDVINLSLGSSQDPGVTAQAVYDAAYNAGVLIVAAAGNSGRTNGKGTNTIYPANYASVIAVAATDSNDVRAYFSSTGPNVELAAPGLAVHSTWNDNSSASNPQPVCDNGTRGCYKDASGTSMASPQVAGVAALVIAAGVVDASGNGHVNDEVRAILQNTAVDLGASGEDAWYGHGLVDASAAIAAVGSVELQAPVAHAGADQTLIDVDNNGSELVTLDASASYDADGSIVSYEWYIGEALAATGVAPVIELGIATHTIMLKVTDNDGQSDTDKVVVTINPYAEDQFTLSVTGYKVKGVQKADLTWSGFATANVDVYRNSTRLTTMANTGKYTDNINQKGGGSYTYKVCAGSSITMCSPEAKVSF